MSRKINWLKAVREISSPFSQALYSCHVGAMSRARLPAPGFALQKHLATLTQQPEHNWNLWTAVSFVWGQVISRVSYLIASKCKAVWKPAICAQSSFTGETSSVKIKSLLSWHTVAEPWGDLGPSPVSSRDLVLGIWLFQKFFSLPTVTLAFFVSLPQKLLEATGKTTVSCSEAKSSPITNKLQFSDRCQLQAEPHVWSSVKPALCFTAHVGCAWLHESYLKN